MERRTAGPARRARIRSGRRKVSLNIDIAIGIGITIDIGKAFVVLVQNASHDWKPGAKQ